VPADRRIVMAIDPGRCKCGVAVVAGGAEIEVLHRAVVETEGIGEAMADLSTRYEPRVILIGNGTTAAGVAKAAQELGLPVELVDERLTSMEARRRYFAENPPRGLRRLIPTSLQTPPQSCDDYAAVILAQRYLTKGFEI
jgi:RNase H-fold protein (predicted Holliday junction resolvase)